MFTKRFVGGTDTKISTSRAEANLRRVFDDRRARAADRQQENAISVLLGTNPKDIQRGVPLVDQPLPITPIGLTSELLRRRPDIRQAEQTMIGANAGIGVAVANFFPTIGLSTLYGGASNKIGSVLKDSASLWNIAANLSGPIFQGGKLLESYYAQQALGRDDRELPRDDRQAGGRGRWYEDSSSSGVAQGGAVVGPARRDATVARATTRGSPTTSRCSMPKEPSTRPSALAQTRRDQSSLVNL